MAIVLHKHFPKCVVIIFLDHPTNLLDRAQTYSSYMHHNTLKYLIGMTPQGTVSYIRGRTSDKFLTEHSTFLNNLIPGETVLVDRGFDIKDSVGLLCSWLQIPNAISIEQTRNIANVLIHVEQVIRNVRKNYFLLNATQPIDFMMSVNNEESTLDKIVYVSGALINICDSVVLFD